MKSKFAVIWATLLFLTQACAPTSKPVPPASSDSPTAPQSDSSAPIVETTLPQVDVSTAVAASTSQPLTQLATETPSTGSNTIPAEGITKQDNGKTFTMKAGDSFLLNLGMDIYDWTVSMDNENVLRMKTGVMVIQGAQGIYEALSPGTATLTAVGNPRCLQSTPPCAMPSILFRVTVIVE